MSLLSSFQAKYYIYAPQILFATFALISGFLTLAFPETADKVLPTTMEEALDLANRQRQAVVGEEEAKAAAKRHGEGEATRKVL